MWPIFIVTLGIAWGWPTTAVEPSDSTQVAARLDSGMFPVWGISQGAPILPTDGTVSLGLDMTMVSTCPQPILEFNVPSDVIAPYFDSNRMVTEIYVTTSGSIARHDIDSQLNRTEFPVVSGVGGVWLAEDLDRDGVVDLVTQAWDQLRIVSAPDWRVRGSFSWPGMTVAMNPVAISIDSDTDLEVFAVPHDFDSSRAVVIDYDPVLDTFVLISDIYAPFWTRGHTAAGDFDNDGRTEFVTGNEYGYGLFEWQDSGLVYVGQANGTVSGRDYFASTVEPTPNAGPLPLVGHSFGNGEFRYDLLTPNGDNEFSVLHSFSVTTGFIGIHPSHGADIDCDGLDELVMAFPSYQQIWEWDVGLAQFVQSCAYESAIYGTIINWYTVDLDQDGTKEFGSVNHQEVFRALPGSGCVFCDSTGRCNPDAVSCYCYCAVDPQCDHVTNVLDVVHAVNVAFRSGTPITDPHPQCPHDLTDADCSGFTNVLDVVHFVNVAFRSADPAIEFCDPCGP